MSKISIADCHASRERTKVATDATAAMDQYAIDTAIGDADRSELEKRRPTLHWTNTTEDAAAATNNAADILSTALVNR